MLTQVLQQSVAETQWAIEVEKVPNFFERQTYIP